MKIIFVKDYEQMSAEAGELIAAQMKIKPNCVLGLATGSTPEGTYEYLANLYGSNKIDFSKVTSFNLDDYYGLAPEHEQSYRYFMNKHLFSKVNIPIENTHVPSGIAEDIDAACAEYDRAMEASGGVDLQLLGIGINGHIGFNEPDDKFTANTHLVRLDESTIKANARFFDDPKDVPKQAVSMGIKNILQARKILLLASGQNKAEAIYQTVLGPITPSLPASALQLHSDVVLIVDEAAGQKLWDAKKQGKVHEYVRTF